MSAGLTVPFALAAGLSGAIDTTSIIVTAGLAEIAAGSIDMGRWLFGGEERCGTLFQRESQRRIRSRRETGDRQGGTAAVEPQEKGALEIGSALLFPLNGLYAGSPVMLGRTSATTKTRSTRASVR